ncbi:hypothetical protein Trydic_g13528 [Trypoxylus dichotomus]
MILLLANLRPPTGKGQNPTCPISIRRIVQNGRAYFRGDDDVRKDQFDETMHAMSGKGSRMPLRRNSVRYAARQRESAGVVEGALTFCLYGAPLQECVYIRTSPALRTLEGV